jgi:acyl-CoA dehydrogenase
MAPWTWREEFGNEAVWQVRLGRAVAEKGASSLWADLTELQKAVG